MLFSIVGIYRTQKREIKRKTVSCTVGPRKIEGQVNFSAPLYCRWRSSDEASPKRPLILNSIPSSSVDVHVGEEGFVSRLEQLWIPKCVSQGV